MGANRFSSLLNRVPTFRKEYVVSPTLPEFGVGGFDPFGQYDARLLRYHFFWALFENTPYDTAHMWAESYKTLYSLYRYTRGTFNPFFRLGEFWATHLLGGSLDINAGDGYEVPSALPILAGEKNEAIRPPIAKLWLDSDWQQNKDTFARMGAVLGDVALGLVDDPDEGKVAIEVIHPGVLKWIDRDRWGNVRAYIREELRLDPDFRDDLTSPFLDPADQRMVVRYTEKCYLEGDNVVYETFLNEKPYGWYGNPAKWSLPYGFIPLVVHPHLKVSPTVSWGWSEFHTGGVKGREVDDLGSKLHDQIRKTVEGMWFFSGVQAPKANAGNPATTSGTATRDNVDPGRQEMKVVYAQNGATAVPLVLPLPISEVSLELRQQLDELEKDYPELMYQSKRINSDSSGKAIRELKKGAEAKVHARRAGYDHAVVRIQRMGVAVGGMRGYDGYQGFGLADLKNGRLDHRIGDRPVFHVDPMDKIERQQLLWTAGKMSFDAGYPTICFLRDNGWTQDQIDSFVMERNAEIASNVRVTGATKLAEASAAASVAPDPVAPTNAEGKATGPAPAPAKVVPLESIVDAAIADDFPAVRRDGDGGDVSTTTPGE